MEVLDELESPLDAEFDVERSDSGWDVILHARYGGRGSARRKNVDYFPALELLLARLTLVEAEITAITVDSRVAVRLPWPDRLLDLDYPLRLSDSTDVADLRLAITRAQRSVARDPAAGPDGGNNHKRIRVSVRIHEDLDATAVATLLERGVAGERRRGTIGRDYRDARADPTVAAAEVFTFDPAIRERALAAHAWVQNSLASVLRDRGASPRSPRPSEPDFDLAWEATGIVVAEVKSLTGANEHRQLRLAVGQVLHYRHLLAERYGPTRAVIAVEYEPAAVWQAICSELSIVLTWPPDWHGLP